MCEQARRDRLGRLALIVCCAPSANLQKINGKVHEGGPIVAIGEADAIAPALPL
jgi:hypothetical protein